MATKLNATKPNDNILYIALSDLFIADIINYSKIAERIMHFPIECIEQALFRYVAPVCYLNLSSPIPSAWNHFGKKWLLDKINLIKKQEETYFGRLILKISFLKLKKKFHFEWLILKNMLELKQEQKQIKNKLSNNTLYIALSDIFVGFGLNYKKCNYIAEKVKHFPIEYIEDVFFRYVVPVCYHNVYVTTPELDFFDEEWLLQQINSIKKQEETSIGRFFLKIRFFDLKWRFNEIWLILKMFIMEHKDC